MKIQNIITNGHTIEYFWNDGQTRKIDEVNIECIQDAINEGEIKGELWQCDNYDNEYSGEWKVIENKIIV